MMKRFGALLLCLLMCASAFVGCAGKKNDDDKGAYITMYLSKQIYNFDPAYAYNDEQAESIVSMLFARLFTLSKGGDLKYDLAKSYKIIENDKTMEYKMTITLRNAWWSDKTKVTADDVVYAWKRILNSENSFSCASLLFDLKNARAVKAGNCSIDDLGVCSLNDTTLQITFERPIDYDRFLINLTSLALAPLREDYVTKTDDWAKKPGTMVTSGPFKISKTLLSETSTKYTDTHAMQADGTYYFLDKKDNLTNSANYAETVYSLLVLERNACYLRDPGEDYAIDKSVTPYRILIDCSRTDEELAQAYKNGEIFYMGSIPCSLRNDSELMKKAKITDALSTQTLFLNENALLTNASTKEEVALFAIPGVRRALSLALDREAIADALVLADPATGLVPNGIFNKGTSGSFRKTGGDLIATTADLTAAKNALSEAGVKASDYTFTIIANPNNDALTLMATAAAEAWSALGFHVTVEARGTITNNDYYKPTDSVPNDICDELYLENLLFGDYAVLAIDSCAYTADAYSMLSPFAADFSGMVDADFNMIPHSVGYNNSDYNDLMEAVYYLPYFSQITAEDYNAFVMYNSAEEFAAVLERVKAIYDKYEIDPAKTKALADARAKLLHAAEELLVTDMPVIPVVFNKNATLTGKGLSGIGSNLYVSYVMTKAKLKNYEKYLADFEEIYSAKKSK